MPVPVGSGSLEGRPVGVVAPLLVIVTVKPICSPALTEAASAVLATSMSAQLTVVESERSEERRVGEVSEAVLSYVPHDPLVVLLTMWTVVWAPPARVVGL